MPANAETAEGLAAKCPELAPRPDGLRPWLQSVCVLGHMPAHAGLHRVCGPGSAWIYRPDSRAVATELINKSPSVGRGDFRRRALTSKRSGDRIPVVRKINTAGNWKIANADFWRLRVNWPISVEVGLQMSLLGGRDRDRDIDGDLVFDRDLEVCKPDALLPSIRV